MIVIYVYARTYQKGFREVQDKNGKFDESQLELSKSSRKFVIKGQTVQSTSLT